MSDHPVLIDLDGSKPEVSPADAPPVTELSEAPTGQAMQTLATLAARPPSRLAAWFWRSLLALVLFLAGVAAWDFLAGLVSRNPVLAAAAPIRSPRALRKAMATRERISWRADGESRRHPSGSSLATATARSASSVVASR